VWLALERVGRLCSGFHGWKDGVSTPPSPRIPLHPQPLFPKRARGESIRVHAAMRYPRRGGCMKESFIQENSGVVAEATGSFGVAAGR
jgi:hypothetical protein